MAPNQASTQVTNIIYFSFYRKQDSIFHGCSKTLKKTLDLKVTLQLIWNVYDLWSMIQLKSRYHRLWSCWQLFCQVFERWGGLLNNSKRIQFLTFISTEFLSISSLKHIPKALLELATLIIPSKFENCLLLAFTAYLYLLQSVHELSSASFYSYFRFQKAMQTKGEISYR